MSQDDGVTPDDEDQWVENLWSDQPPGGFLGPGWREWLHDVYSLWGPLSDDEVDGLICSEIESRAQHVCTLVGDDALSTLGRQVKVSTIVDGWTVRVVVDNQIASGVGLVAIDVEALTVEVADAVQEEIVEAQWSVWPECLIHRVGLHPELTREGASWVCRLGEHRVAGIGHLKDA